MRVLILGANGMMGPWVSKLFKEDHEIIETDLVKIDSNINFYKIDISNLKEVLEISQNVDAIINLSVYRNSRDLAFNVNTLGTYNMMKAAEEHKISRIINTGPHFVLAGPSFETYDFNINSFFSSTLSLTFLSAISFDAAVLSSGFNGCPFASLALIGCVAFCNIGLLAVVCPYSLIF